MSTTCQTIDTSYSYTISNLTINVVNFGIESYGNTIVQLNMSITYNNSSTNTPDSAYLTVLSDLNNCSLYEQKSIDNENKTLNTVFTFNYDATLNTTLYWYISSENPSVTYMDNGGYVSVALSYANEFVTYTVTYATTTSTTGTTTTPLTISQAPVLQF